MNGDSEKQKSFRGMLVPLVLLGVVGTYALFVLIFLPSLKPNMIYVLPVVLIFGVIDLVVVLTIASGVLIILAYLVKMKL